MTFSLRWLFLQKPSKDHPGVQNWINISHATELVYRIPVKKGKFKSIVVLFILLSFKQFMSDVPYKRGNLRM